MTSATIGSARVDLAMNAGKFEDGVKKAKTRMKELQTGFGSFADTISKHSMITTAAVTAMVAGFGYMLLRTVEQTDKFGKLAQSLGMTTEKLSAMKYAIEIGGGQFEDFTKAMRKLAQAVGDLSRGDNTTLAARQLVALGIAVKDATGNVRPLGDILDELAIKFSQSKDGVTKTAAAVALFGRSGATLIPMLNSGATGFRQMQEEASKFGIVISKDAALRAAEFDDNMTKLKRIFEGFTVSIIDKTLPAINSLVGGFISLIENEKEAHRVTWLLNQAYDAMAAFLKPAQDAVSYLKDKLGEAVTASANYIDSNGKVWQSVDYLTRKYAELRGTTVESIIAQAKVLESWTPKIVEQHTEQTKSLMAVAQSTKDLSEEQRKQNEALMFGKRMAEEYRTPLEKIEERQRKLKDAMDRGAISATIFGRAMADASVFSKKNIANMADDISGSLTKLFGDTKAVAIATALINTYQGVTKALAEYPPPLSFAMAGLQLAAGMAQVANIRSQTSTGGSGGGASVGGGSGGATAAIATAQAAQAPQERTLLVQGISPNEMFSGEVVRTLAKKLVQAQRDGIQVVVK